MTRRLVLLAVAVLLLAGAACGDDSPAIDVPEDPTTTTTEAEASSTTASTGATSTTSGQAAALPATAEEASKALYNAWKADDRAAAEKVATKKAIDSLFDRKWTGPDMSFQGCEPTPAGADCFWMYEGGGTTFHVAKEGSGYRVASMESVAD